MKIDSGTIGMESARSYRSTNVSIKRFTIADYREGSLTGQGNGLNTAVSDGQNGNGKTEAEEKQGVTDAAGNRLYTVEDWRNSLGISRRVSLREANSGSIFEDIRQSAVRYVFELLFGNRSGRLGSWEDGRRTYGDTTQSEENFFQSSQTSQTGSLFSSNVSGTFQVFRFNIAEQGSMQYEREDTSFSTQGTVRTADGREIRFNVDIGMSREFQQFTQTNLSNLQRAVNMCDPLVINLDTNVAKLSDQKFYFDIDADGVMDEISRLGAGSGYLALDKNGDGVINDGSELFGTASGDGFADLAKYDEDGNGWIDENDAIWSKLKIWCKDENGQDVLYRLADKGVGAICLQRAATDFTMQGMAGQVNGAIRSTGVFLYENGNVGTVQHVDVAKYEQGA